MPRFGSLRSYEQLDALATHYHCLPSDVLRTSYAEYCINEACAIAGEARDARRLETQNPPEMTPRRVGSLMVGAFHRETEHV